MTKLVIDGAKLKCSQGTSQGSLTVLPTIGADADEKPTATVNDYIPMTNIGTFGMCQTQANPQVAAATAAAQGVLTPQPCIPVTTSAWSPGSSVVTIKDVNALTDDSKCNCTWTGSIEITDSGTSVEVD
jgi:hypothetical protein